MSDDFEQRVRQAGEAEKKAREAKRTEEVRQRLEGESRLSKIEAALRDWNDPILGLIDHWVNNANRPGSGLYVHHLPEPIREVSIPGPPSRGAVRLP